ncbi:MAG: diacylglycerol kinase family protein [Actinomycetota bacterium]|nr:diacylglycerol kinase family protein [Actinomycetota bacterium]
MTLTDTAHRAARSPMTDVAVVVNSEKLGKREQRALRLALTAAGCADVKWYDAPSGSRATAATKKALKRGARTVVVCGGDGTVRAAAEAVVGTSVALAIVPCGTANLLVSGLGLPTDIQDVVDTVVGGSRRRIDSAECNGRTFNVMAGVGFDVAMLDGAEASKERLGFVAYMLSGVREARSRKRFHVTVTIDGQRFFSGRASCVLVGNGGRLKGGVEAFPGATPTDGRIHVAVLTAIGIRQWSSLAISSVMRRQRWSAHARLADGSTIVAEFRTRQRFEMDGGVKQRAKRLEFVIRPRALTLCVPPEH